MDQANAAKEARKAVIANELEWHEQEAHRRISLDEFLYAPPAFDAVVNSSVGFLQVRPGELVLDLGCGEGKETLDLARRGLLVLSMDLSHQQLSRARDWIREKAPEAQVHFIQANAEELPFAANSFRIIYGKAILHHLDLDISAHEIKRLLQDDGRATFAEPMAHHPIIWLGRWLTPKLRTRDEHPLTFRELRQFGASFDQPQLEAYFLLAPLAYFVRFFPGGKRLFQRVHYFLQRVDRRLFHLFKSLKGLAWYSVIKVGK